MKRIIQFVERQPAPALLPILRSQQQGEILALLLGDPALELSLTEIAARAGAPQSSVHREIERSGISSTALLATSSSVSGARCRQLSETRTGWNQERGRSTTR